MNEAKNLSEKIVQRPFFDVIDERGDQRRNDTGGVHFHIFTVFCLIF